MKKLMILVLALSVLLSGCGLLGVSQDDYDELQADYKELQEEYEELEEKYDKLRDDYKALTKDSDDVADAPAADAPVADAPVEESPASGFSEDKVLSQLTVNQTNFYGSWSNYTFLEIENHSDHLISGTAEVKFYDADGNLVGVTDNYFDAFAPNTVCLLSFYTEDEFATAEYELSIYEETYYRSVTESLDWDSTTGTDKEIVTIYNNGDETASGVYVQMLFLLGDEIVEYYNTYCYEIEPGDSDSMEMYCYEEYDNYIIYYSGYAY